jgi:hypothetical protein
MTAVSTILLLLLLARRRRTCPLWVSCRRFACGGAFRSILAAGACPTRRRGRRPSANAGKVVRSSVDWCAPVKYFMWRYKRAAASERRQQRQETTSDVIDL